MTWDDIAILMVVAGFIGFVVGKFVGYGDGYKEGHIDRVKMMKNNFKFLERV